MATIQGHCDSKFYNVRDLLQQNIDSGEELGAAIVINVDGKNVVDIHGGYVDASRTQPWEDTTIVNVWSSTKIISALAVLMCHERGLLDVNENVSKYWPEFAVNGKENVKIRHIMSHTSGVSGWEQPITIEDLYDVKESTERLAQQPPFWEPGTASGYHSLTMGHLLGEVVRRVTGKGLTQFVAEEIAGPLGADFQVGAVEKDWPRITNVIAPPPLPIELSNLDPDSIPVKTFAAPSVEAETANTPGWRRAEVGAANGHGSARGLARILSAISLGGTVDGHKLLSQKTIDLIFQKQSDSVDLANGQPIRFGIGYAISGGSTEQGVPFAPRGKDRRTCFWGGWGGFMEHDGS
ncbi:Beta-lactamase domain-containing protein 2 [Exophiala dermatitidis]